MTGWLPFLVSWLLWGLCHMLNLNVQVLFISLFLGQYLNVAEMEKLGCKKSKHFKSAFLIPRPGGKNLMHS